MRIIKEETLGPLKYTYLQWNNKFLVKIEVGSYEQTYKVPETETSLAQLEKSVTSDHFVEKVFKRFEEMDEDFSAVLEE